MSDRPTSPVTTPPADPPIEAVFGDSTPEEGRAAQPVSLIEEWRQFGAFLKRPRLDASAQSNQPLRLLWRIYLLDMLAMLMLIIAASIAVAAGVYLPETAIAGIEFTPIIVLSVIIAAPLFEEIAFRSWLSGRLANIAALLCLVAGAGLFAALHTTSPLGSAAAIVLGLIGAAAAYFVLRTRPAMRWFVRWFPGFFWLATVSFALIHLANFSEGSIAILLPLVLPQFILGTMLGYVRVRIGLWAAIGLHAVHNATALGIAALAGGLE